jgi:triacylglycerol esterase/lipase EstA (alpha/beta hydrolase family)
LRLDKAANALATALVLLRERYECEQIDVVAHSMGGLVSRGAIQRAVYITHTNFVPHLVTISTPWGGHTAAEMGVKHLNFPVPSWYDMVPDSDYLKGIMAKPLPAGTRYDLIFSYKSSSQFGLADENDGVVAVNSELLLPAQEQAVSVLGLEEDHMSILNSKEALKRVEESLAH